MKDKQIQLNHQLLYFSVILSEAPTFNRLSSLVELYPGIVFFGGFMQFDLLDKDAFTH